MNYFVLAGAPKRDEDIGYFGERLVLKAQELGKTLAGFAGTLGKDAKAQKLGGELICTVW